MKNTKNSEKTKKNTGNPQKKTYKKFKKLTKESLRFLERKRIMKILVGSQICRQREFNLLEFG